MANNGENYSKSNMWDLNHCAFKETSMMSVIKYWMNSFHLFRYMMESSTKS